MKIIEIEITNFKSIGATIRIPIRPITLMFGENSVGKSSVLQCLLLLAQSLDNDGVLRPRGEKVDLGSFKNLIYQHDNSKSLVIKVRFELNPDWEWIIGYKEDGEEDFGAELNDVAKKFRRSLEGFTEGAVSLSFKLRKNKPEINNFCLYLGEEKEPVFTYINEDDINFKHRNSRFVISHQHSYWEKYHGVFIKDILGFLLDSSFNLAKCPDSYSGKSDILKNSIITQLKKFESGGCHIDDLIDLVGMEYSEHKSYYGDIERFNNFLNGLQKIKKFDREHSKLIELFLFETHEESYYSQPLFPVEFRYKSIKNWLDKRHVKSDFDSIDFHPGWLAVPIFYEIKTYLNGMQHIQALRQSPKRYYLPEDDEVKYFKYMELFPDALEDVNTELIALNQPYKIQISRLEDEVIDEVIYKIKFQHVSKGVDVTIKDVGFGFSQVLPIIIKAIVSPYCSFLIEQPELHLHPRMQSELGDFFIRRIKGGKNKFIIETHSEHLVLRLLRRIRQTTNGNLPNDVPPLTTEDVAIIHFKHGAEGISATHLPVTVDGDFEQEWPEGFFDEREKELFD